jgi:hypothetical protein
MARPQKDRAEFEGKAIDVPEHTLVQLTTKTRDIDRLQEAETLKAVNMEYEDGDEPLVLRARSPWVPNRGWLNFFGGWSYVAESPADEASWAPSLTSATATLVIGLQGLEAGAKYIVSIDLSCFAGSGAQNPGFYVKAHNAAQMFVAAVPVEQTLDVILTADSAAGQVKVSPLDLLLFVFHSAEIAKASG